MHILSTRNQAGAIQKGELFDLPCQCADVRNVKKCAEFYNRVFAELTSSFHVCPFGYAVYYKRENGLAYIGLKVNGISKKGKNGGAGVYLPAISKERVLCVIGCEEEMIDAKNECANIRRLKSELLHGMEKILGTCRAKSESLLAAIDNDDSAGELPSLRQDLKTILMGNIELRNLFYATRMRFDAALSNKRYPTVVYNKFFKAKKLLHKYEGRDIPIIFEGASYSKYNLTASFEILPYLLLENASKFALSGDRVQVNFAESDNRLMITISNIGPYTSKPQSELCKDRERGEYSAEAKIEGSGIGLFTCHEIATLNQLAFEVKSDSGKIIYVNDIPYAPFTVSITIPADLHCSD